MDHPTHDIADGLPTISPAIPGRWVHQPEEDAGGVEVYRGGSAAPIRDAIELGRNSTVVLEEANAAGQIHRVKGHWTQPTIDRIRLTFADGAHAPFILQAVEEPEPTGVLRVRRVPDPTPTISPAIPGRWVHSFEDDAGGVEVYRAEGGDVTTSGRETLELTRQGTFTLDEVGSTGAAVRTTGRWRQPTDDRLTLAFDDADRPAFTLQAVDDTDPGFILRVRRLPEAPSVPPATAD